MFFRRNALLCLPTVRSSFPPPTEGGGEKGHQTGAHQGGGAKASSSVSSPSVPSTTQGVSYKVKKRAPWGDQQLRDSWSVDANSRYDNDSVGQRIQRKYRYHPDEPIRQLLGKCMILGIVGLVGGSVVYHRYLVGDYIWNTFDFTYFMESVRQIDYSPRSAKYHRQAQAVLYSGGKKVESWGT